MKEFLDGAPPALAGRTGAHMSGAAGDSDALVEPLKEDEECPTPVTPIGWTIPSLQDLEFTELSEGLATSADDICLLVYKKIISGFRLQVHRGGTLLLEDEHVVLERTPLPIDVEDDGLDDLPSDVRVRVFVTPDPGLPAEVAGQWLQLFGWQPAQPLEVPPDWEERRFEAVRRDCLGIDQLMTFTTQRILRRPPGEHCEEDDASPALADSPKPASD